MLYWRGAGCLESFADSISPQTISAYERFHRTQRGRLLQLSILLGQNRVDARLSALDELTVFDPNLRRTLHDTYRSNWTESYEWCSRKYVFHTDGQYGGYSYGLGWKLLSGSLLFLVGTPLQESWLQDAIQPWREFVPVKPDFSDIEDKIQWAEENSIEAQRIVARAVKFGLQDLSWEHSLAYFALLLKDYVKILRD